MHATTRSRVLVLAAALVVVACGGTDDTRQPDSATEAVAPTSDSLGPTSAGDAEAAQSPSAQPGSGGASEGPGFGAALNATLGVSGAIEETLTMGPETPFVVAGGCLDDDFGIAIQGNPADQAELLSGEVDPATLGTAVSASANVETDLSGGQTGEFDVEDVEVRVVDYARETTMVFDGPGSIEVVEHVAPNELNDRRMDVTLSATGLEADDGDETLDLEASVTWVMGCP